jgi:hypothetical protein
MGHRLTIAAFFVVRKTDKPNACGKRETTRLLKSSSWQSLNHCRVEHYSQAWGWNDVVRTKRTLFGRVPEGYGGAGRPGDLGQGSDSSGF